VKRSLALTALAFVPLLLVACGGKEAAPAAAPSPGATATAEAAATSAEPTTQPEPAPEPAKPRKPFEIYSACAEVVTVVFAEDPKAANAGKRTIAPSASIEGPRNPDGNQTVWLLDPSGEPLIKVNVTRGMKRVEIGRSCRTLDAR
jgi:hypothetical protein